MASGDTEKVRRLLRLGPLYEGAVSTYADVTPEHARRILRYLQSRGEASRNAAGTWSLTNG